ncbi:phosphotransferase [Streptomyces sp. NBC_01433]|uniref:phosphotransferase family protein n=1 Tax=Streptomyces sp. NBC_01433 TaxID=2903864 RepID=UPI00224CD781|nr:phosphotransferase [Streptomyces sp. NBC_01433]MCX4681063.1 phosphotransferase [Streptomyces sp. NBC_01433]
MNTGEGEVPLSGGRITPGVVRVDDTVRRPVTARSSFVAELLNHLQQCGFTGAPRYLGLDGAGRDTFTYVPGRVPARFQLWKDDQVAAAGALVRSLHEATRSSRLTGTSPIVCHHDPGPNNVVFQQDRPMAFIDFDTAAPGDPGRSWIHGLDLVRLLQVASPTSPRTGRPGTTSRQLLRVGDLRALQPRRRHS